ncbi:LysR family transcriptional regulator [Mangrovitalea sediminis]|uniref:LysR family transcriptional regulator n=1 Tax=Mangrovitalea sediminis TaxID=1982043 RepID=UPI000BE557E5|nr:LysR family transcriptional regulator [Mangrovitalea sediminis]
MDLQSLSTFVAVVDSGSFSAAAETLHLTQPAISKRLAALEQQLDHQLIDRSHRQVRLTEAGQRLLPHARRILDELHNARQQLDSQDIEVAGGLPLIASHHMGLHHLPAWLRRFKREFPAVTLSFQFMESERAFDHLRRAEAELAFVTLNDSMDDAFEVHHSWEDPMCFVCAKDHPLAQLEHPVLADLEPYDALLPDTGTETYRVVSRLFLQENVRLHVQMATNYLETLKMMASVGLGWSVLPRTMLDGSLHAMPLQIEVRRMLGAVGLRRRRLSRAAQALMSVVSQS